MLDSIQLTAKHKVATPVNWNPGEDVIIAGSVSNEDAKKKYRAVGKRRGRTSASCRSRSWRERCSRPRPRSWFEHRVEKLMRTRVVVLGAGFGGLELTTMLSNAFGDAIDIVLVDKGDAFVFGFSKLDVMFGRQLPAAVRHRTGTSSSPASVFSRRPCGRSIRRPGGP